MTALPRNIAAQAQPPSAVAAAAILRKLAQGIERILWTARLPVNTEAELQLEVAKLFDARGFIYVREVKVSGGRIDFLIGYAGRFAGHTPSVGLEIKIKGGKRAIHRQCAAYCGDPRVGHLIVLSGTALALPPEMNGKAVTIVHVGRAWL